MEEEDEMRQLCFTCGRIEKAKGSELKYECQICGTMHYIPKRGSSITIKTNEAKRKK